MANIKKAAAANQDFNVKAVAVARDVKLFLENCLRLKGKILFLP